MKEPDRWWDDALCAQTDPEVFHPQVGGSTAAAKRVCSSCRVRAQCLDWALSMPFEDDRRGGVLGGLTFTERQRIRRESA